MFYVFMKAIGIDYEDNRSRTVPWGMSDITRIV